MPYLATLKNLFKKFLDSDPAVNDFQNIINSSLSTETRKQFFKIIYRSVILR